MRSDGNDQIAMLYSELYVIAQDYPGIYMVIASNSPAWVSFQLTPVIRELTIKDDEQTELYINNRCVAFKNGSKINFDAFTSPEKIGGWEAEVIWYHADIDTILDNSNIRHEIENRLRERLRRNRFNYPLRFITTKEVR